MAISLNNLMVENLRTGKDGAIKTLVGMGQGPFVTLDYVEASRNVAESATTGVTTRSIWFWIHQAPLADAVAFCWDHRLERDLAALPPKRKADTVLRALEEATAAALGSGHVAPWLLSWERLQAHAKPFEPGAWIDRTALVAVLGAGVLAHGDRSVALLIAADAGGQLVRADVQHWTREPSFLRDVVARGYPDLLQALIDLGGVPAPPDLAHLTATAEQELAGVLRADSGLWTHEDFGRRRFECLRVLVQTQSGYRMDEDLVQAVAERAGSLSGEGAALREFALSHRLGSPVTAPAGSRRRL